MRSNYSAFVPNVHFEQITIKNLVSNQDYQRNLSLSHVKKIVENFDLYQINPVKVSRRNGLNLVINGQHTIESVAHISGSRETPVWCMIYDDLDYEEEADMFANQQKYVKPLQALEMFMAGVESGSEKYLTIKSLVESYGLILSPTRSSGSIAAIACIEKLYEKYGYHALDRALRLCVITWQGEPISLSANMINGVARLILAFGDAIKDDVFKEKVGFYTARDISRTARERRAGSLGFAEAMLMAYNRKTKAGLQWGKLYSSRGRTRVIPDFSDEVDEPEKDYAAP